MTMIWKTTLTNIFLPLKSVKNCFHSFFNLENLSGTGLKVILPVLVFALNYSVSAQNNQNSPNSIIEGDDCIIFDSCPEDQVICATDSLDGVLGAYVDWSTPVITQTCTGNGSVGNFQMLFELNENLLTEECWYFNWITRAGGNGGHLKLFNSVDGDRSGTSVVATPFLILNPQSETSFEIQHANGEYYIQLFLEDANGNTIESGAKQQVTKNSDTYTFYTQNTETGVYRLKYVFTYVGSKPSNANTGDTLIAVDGILNDDGCKGGIDFTVSGPQQGFYPVGSHDLEYVATYTSNDGATRTKSCTFNITIDAPREADAPENIEACDAYTLPALENGAYFAAAGGVDPIEVGTEITATQTIYVYTAAQGSCEAAENSFTITINDTPVADAPANVEACDSYMLPALDNGAYFASEGGVDPIAAGTEITATQTIYVYSEGAGSCEAAENSFTVSIIDTPVADAPENVEACDSYTLPALENGAYFAAAGGVDPIEVGTEITATQTIYVLFRRSWLL
jgi:hypothetical protein